MKQSFIKITAVMLFFCFTSPTLSAATSVGKAIISIGKVFTTTKDGVENKLKRRGKVYEGDTIKVGDKSRLQIRFIDNQLVVLKANTVFRIDEYKFKDSNDQNKSAVVSLLKGGMRSVTGLIGKSSRDKYKVKTPAATLGVRGTHYAIQLCNGQCGNGIQGLVGTVLEGQVELINDTGSQFFGVDQFFNVPAMNQPPQPIFNPPAILVSRTEAVQEKRPINQKPNQQQQRRKTAGALPPPPVDGDGAALPPPPGDGTLALDGGGQLPPPDDGTALPPPPGDGQLPPPPQFTSGTQLQQNTTSGGFSIGTTTGKLPINATQAPFGAVLALAGYMPGDPQGGAGGIVGREGINAQIGIATVGGAANQPVRAVINDPMGDAAFVVFEGATVFEGGGDTLGVNWGRWANPDLAFKDGGQDVVLNNGILFAYSDNQTPPAVVSGMSGSMAYTIDPGSPNFRDESGVAVVSSDLTITVDFSGSQISAYSGNLFGNSRSYVVSLDSMTPLPLSDLLTSGLAIKATCTGSGTPCGVGGINLMGEAGGAFIGPNAEGILGHFGLNDSSGTVGVYGVGLFK